MNWFNFQLVFPFCKKKPTQADILVKGIFGTYVSICTERKCDKRAKSKRQCWAQFCWSLVWDAGMRAVFTISKREVHTCFREILTYSCIVLHFNGTLQIWLKGAVPQPHYLVCFERESGRLDQNVPPHGCIVRATLAAETGDVNENCSLLELLNKYLIVKMLLGSSLFSSFMEESVVLTTINDVLLLSLLSTGCLWKFCLCGA